MAHRVERAPDRPLGTRSVQQYHLLPRLHLALVKHPQVPPMLARRFHLLLQTRPLPTVGDVRARLSRLRDLDTRIADGVHVSQADAGFVQLRHGEVLGKRAIRQCWHTELFAPERIVAGRVREHRLVRPTMVLEVRLTVARQISTSQPDRPANRKFVEAGPPRLVEWICGAWLTVDRGHADLD